MIIGGGTSLVIPNKMTAVSQTPSPLVSLRTFSVTAGGKSATMSSISDWLGIS